MKLHSLFLISVLLVSTDAALDRITYILKEHDNVILGNIATDAELDNNLTQKQLNNLKFRFVSSDETDSSRFVLNADTGDLSAGYNIDAEEICKNSESSCLVSLEVAATVDSFFVVVHVDVTIIDVNDHEPTFPRQHDTLTIPESDAANSKYVIDSATDGDIGTDNSVITYELVSSDGVFGLEKQATLGGGSILRLVLKKKLDRETRESYSLMVLAHDNGIPAMSSSMTLDVDVGDSNDNSPKFSKSLYNVTLTEGIDIDTIVATVTASDRDIGENAQIKYKLSSGQDSSIYSLFSINENTGDVSVIRDLKYTQNQPIKIIVEAYNPNDLQRFNQSFVHVHVLDTTNNPPEMIVKMISGTDFATVNESVSKGKVIAYVRVKDADTGANGEIVCDLQDRFFELKKYADSQYNVVVKSVLDRETDPEHYLEIECQDKGTPPMNSSYPFKVKVEDANDHAPIFSRDTYSVNIDENNEAGASIVTVVAFDSDDGKFSEITYKVDPDYTDRVFIDKKSGEIKALVDFDREHDSQIIFEVYAFDGGSPPLNGTAKVLIRINDVNDFRPKFIRAPFQFEVPENAPEGFNVGNITAFDLDDGDNARLLYTMSTPSADFPFVLLSNGVLKLKTELDRETRNRYDFEVVASDLGMPPLRSSSSVTIVVNDVNDNTPEIWYPGNLNNTLKVSSEATSYTHIATVRAFDKDEGANGRLQYTLKSEINSSIIDIHHVTGELFVTRDLSDKDIGSFKYDVIVSDGGSPPLTSYATLHVQIGASHSSLSLEETDRAEYTIIAIVLVAATLVVASAIILALVIIRKFDSNRRPRNKPLCGDIEKKPVDMTAMQVTDVDGPKKVVQFTFPPQPSPEEGTPEHYSQLHPIGFRGPSTFRQDTNIDQELNQYHLATLHSPQQNQRTGVHNQKFSVQLPPKPDDARSDSSGDLNASDSGKGGSVEDLRSQLDMSQNDASASHNVKPPRRNLYFNPEHNHQFAQPSSHTNSASSLVDNKRPVNYGDFRTSYKVKSVPSAQEYPYQKFNRQFLDCSMSSGVTLEDDGDTTTSGSYTVDCEDLDMDVAVNSARSSNI